MGWYAFELRGGEGMIWRLILAVVLLVAIVGGIVGFNLFRDKMIAGYFASMQPPPVTVSTIEVEPVTWKPGLSAIGTARAAQGVELAVETAGIVREVLFNANDHIELGQHLAQLDDSIERADLAAAQASLELSQTQLDRAIELRNRGVTAINDLDEAQATQRSAQAQVVKLTAVMDQKASRRRSAASSASRRSTLASMSCPARSMRRCRISTLCASTSRSPSSRFGYWRSACR